MAISLLGVVLAEVLLRSSGYWAEYVRVRNSPLYTVRTLSNVINYPFNLFTQAAWRVFRQTMIGYVTLPLLAIGVAGAALALRRNLRLTVVYLAWALVPTAGAIFFTTYPFPRHFMSGLPPFLVLVAYAAVLGWQWVSGRSWRTAGRGVYAVLAVLALVPALLFDGRVLAHPATFRYPSLDDWQYVSGVPAGTEWPAVADAIRHRAVGARVVIVTPNADPTIVRDLLGNDPRYVFTNGDEPLGKHAQFALHRSAGQAVRRRRYGGRPRSALRRDRAVRPPASLRLAAAAVHRALPVGWRRGHALRAAGAAGHLTRRSPAGSSSTASVRERSVRSRSASQLDSLCS